MATRYQLDAVITARNTGSDEWAKASNDVRGFANELRRVPNEISVGIDLENASNDIAELNTRLEQGVNDVKVSVDFEDLTNDIAAMNARLTAGLRDQTVEVKIDYDRSILGSIARESGVAASSLANLEQNQIDVGQAAIRSSNVIRSSGFIALLGAISVAAYAIGPAIQAAGGATIALGSAATSAGIGVGLLVGAIVPSITRFQDYKKEVDAANATLKTAEKGTDTYREAQKRLAGASKLLTDQEKNLLDQWGRTSGALSDDRGFKQANNTILGLAGNVLELSRHALPALGREADETADAFDKAARDVARSWGTHEQNSVNRLLDNASNTIGDITRAVGNFGGGIANMIGSPAAVRAAQDFTGYLNDITGDFRDWSRTARAREGISDWLERAKNIGGGAADAIGAIARAISRFDDKDAENVADGLRGIGRGAAFLIDSVRWVGRDTAGFIRFLDDSWKKVDRLDGEMHDAGRRGGGADTWADALGRMLRAGSGPGWQLDNWLRDMSNKRLPDFSGAQDKNARNTREWANTHEKQTKQAKAVWQEQIAHQVVNGDLANFNSALDKNEKNTRGWSATQDKETNQAEGFWARRVYDPSGITGFISRLNDSLDKNQKNTGIWRRGQDEDTNRAKDFWHKRIYDPLGVVGFIGHLGDAQDENEKNTNDWAEIHDKRTRETADRWDRYIVGGVVANTLSRLTGGLASSATDVQDWANQVKDILGSILDFLGISHGSNDSGGGSRGARMSPNTSSGQPGLQPAPSQSGHPGLHYAGGIYQGDLKMMASGGFSEAFVDSEGVYTALTTGMSRAMSEGAIWQAATGGISDGLVPRVVYGEGRPSSSPKKELYVPEDMEPHQAMNLMGQAAEWFVPRMARGGDVDDQRPAAASGRFGPQVGLPPKQPWNLRGGDSYVDYDTAGSDIADLAAAGAAWWNGLVRKWSGAGKIDAVVTRAALPRAIGLTSPNGTIRMDPVAQVQAMAHEFGHALGLGHGGHSIMNTIPRVTNEDWQALAQYYGIGPGGGFAGGAGTGGVGGAPASYNLPPLRGYGATRNWNSTVYEIVRAITHAVPGTNPNTYAGHAGGEEWSSDWWNMGGRGDPVPKNLGDEVASQIAKTDGWRWYIWQGMLHNASGSTQPYYGQFAGKPDRHFDHVHGTWGAGAGIGTSGFDPLAWIAEQLKRIPVPSISLGPYGAMLAPGIRDWTVDKVMEWARDNFSLFGGPMSGGASPSGLDIGGALKQGGWPDSELPHASAIVWRESRGDADAQNASGARGLMQIMPATARGIGVSYDKLFDPIYNTSAGRKLWGMQGYSPWVTNAGWQSDTGHEHDPVTGYTRGGFALKPHLASVAEHGEEFFMPLHDPEAARRFMDFLDRAAKERLNRGSVGAPLSPHRYEVPEMGSYTSERRIVAELRAIRAKLSEVGIEVDSQKGIGDAAASGTISRARRDPISQRDIAEGQDASRNRRDTLTGHTGHFRP